MAMNAELLITFGEALGVMVITPVACYWATMARICAILSTSVKSKLASSLRSVSMTMITIVIMFCCRVYQAVFSPS